MSRFNELFDGYLRDSLSESELREFFQLAEENELLPDERMISEQGFDERHEGLTDEAQREKMLMAVRMRAREMEGSVPMRRWRWLAAAAAAVITAVAGVYLVGGRERTQAIVKVKTYKNDVAPGVNGAVLRLSDGSEIVLDSTGNGELSRQGNTKVIKQAGGRLVYQEQGTNDAILYNTLSTARGKQFRMVLPDGTKVWLNSFSSIHYPTSFTAGEGRRLVEITGEVYFEVAANAAMPFIVKTPKEEVTVLGTRFNINSYEDEPAEKATLLEGAIRISHGVDNVLLHPGQQAVMGGNKTGIGVAEVDVDGVVAWKNGFFHFDNADIQTVMRQVARWYDVDVKYNGVPPTTGDFKGEIGRDLTLAQVLKVLEQTRVHFRIEEDKRIVITP